MGENVLKLQFALLGSSGVGKTCLFGKYFGESIAYPAATICPLMKVKKIEVNHLGRNVQVKLTVWDTAGMERYQALMPQYYRATHGFIIVYDITSKTSFEALENCFDNAETFATIEDHAKIVVGNKIDLEKERVVPRAEGLRFAHSKGATFIEASALSNTAVEHIFEKLITQVLRNENLWKPKPAENIQVSSHNTPQPQKGSSCWC